MPDTHQFLDHPETAEAGRRIFEAVTREGDRGAILVASEILSEFLLNSLLAIRPDVVSRKDLKGFTQGSGPLGSWSARTKVAAMTGLISARTFTALEDLRTVRNKAAHSEQPFRLETHAERLNRVADLGSGVGQAVTRMAMEAVFGHVLSTLVARGDELESALGRNVLQDPQELGRRLGEDADLMRALGDQVWRVRLGLSVWLLLGLMRIERDLHLERTAERAAAAPEE